MLGTLEILEPYLATGSQEQEETEEGEEKGGQLPDVRKVVAPLGRLFGRGSRDQEKTEEKATAATVPDGERSEQLPSPEYKGSQKPKVEAYSEEGESLDERELSEEEESRPGLFGRFSQRVRRVLRRERAAVEEEGVLEEKDTEEVVLLFAYNPKLTPLHTAEGLANLSEGLFPLCELHYTERVRPDAIEAIRFFAETGVDIKVLSERAGEQMAAILRQAGLGSDRNMPLHTISGDELAAMNGEELAQAAHKNTVFGHLRPEQFGLVVDTLREDGELVAVVGDGVNDLAAMGRANLAIARRSSSQAALSVADILLLEDSPSALSRVLDKGQRIVRGLLDVLKLNLTFVVSLALLILGLRLVSAGFPRRIGVGHWSGSIRGLPHLPGHGDRRGGNDPYWMPVYRGGAREHRLEDGVPGGGHAATGHGHGGHRHGAVPSGHHAWRTGRLWTRCSACRNVSSGGTHHASHVQRGRHGPYRPHRRRYGLRPGGQPHHFHDGRGDRCGYQLPFTCWAQSQCVGLWAGRISLLRLCAGGRVAYRRSADRLHDLPATVLAAVPVAWAHSGTIPLHQFTLTFATPLLSTFWLLVHYWSFSTWPTSAF